MAEKIRLEILERMDEAYRPVASVQVALFCIIELVVTGLIYHFAGVLGIENAILVWFIVTTLIYPVFIKIRARPALVLGFVLLGATVVGASYLMVAYFLPRAATAEEPGALIRTIALLGACILIIVVYLFHHVASIYRFVKNKWVYLFDAILSVLFCLAMYVFLGWGNQPLPFPWSVLGALGLTLLFAWAVLPERPF